MANAATFWLGLVPVGFGLSATAGTLGVGVIASCGDWLRDFNSRWLVGAAVAVATLLSCATAGPVGLAWGIAYLIAGIVGLFTWRPLEELGANNALVLAALCLTSLVDTVVYVWLLAWFIPATVPGQLLGKTETAIGTVVLCALGRAVWRRLHRRPDTARYSHAQARGVDSRLGSSPGPASATRNSTLDRAAIGVSRPTTEPSAVTALVGPTWPTGATATDRPHSAGSPPSTTPAASHHPREMRSTTMSTSRRHTSIAATTHTSNVPSLAPGGRPAWTPGQIRGLGAATDLKTAAAIFGFSRNAAYEMIRKGQFPVPVIRIGTKYRVPVRAILDVLCLAEDAPTSPTASGSPKQAPT